MLKRLKLFGEAPLPPWLRVLLPLLAVAICGSLLIFVIFFTLNEWQWLAFLSGTLMAALIALASRASRTEWRSLRRSAQLTRIREKLAKETATRQHIQEELDAAKLRMALISRDLPAMLVYVDSDRRYQYHNEAFERWIGLPGHRIAGHTMVEVLGKKTYREIEADVDKALSGAYVQTERMQIRHGGAVFRFSEIFIPRFGERGRVMGVFQLVNDVTRRGDVDAEPNAVSAATPGVPGSAPAGRVRRGTATPEGLYPNPTASAGSASLGTRDVPALEQPGALVMQALVNDRFTLFGQVILPLSPQAAHHRMFEVLVRLSEEEESLVPPGAFLPVLEHFGLMVDLDQLVLRGLLKLLVQHYGASAAVYPVCSVNVSRQTLEDRHFPKYVKRGLGQSGIPAQALCFEFNEPELLSESSAAQRFAQALRQQGCQLALSRFAAADASFALLEKLPVQFIKLDGTLTRSLISDPLTLAKVKDTLRAARTLEARVVAEFVEARETLVKLREIGVDYAQGFEISRPQPLEQLL